MFETVIGIKFRPKAIKGEIKKVIIVIAVVGSPIPMTPFTIPAIRKENATNIAISLELFSRFKISTLCKIVL